MSRHVRLAAFLCALICLLFAVANVAIAVPTVWTGPDVTFTKSGATPEDPLTNNVALSRGGASSGGPFNSAVEDFYDFGAQGPADTEWATELVGLNADIPVTAENYENLDFTNWAEAYGGPGPDLIINIFELNAVVHLISDDIYLNLQFIDFDAGGAMAYVRSTPTFAAPTGDYNNDAVVDGLDYAMWRNNLGDPTEHDINFMGDGLNGVDEEDFNIWKLNYGQPIPPGAGGLAVPEPATALGMIALAALAFQRTRRSD